MTTLKTAATSVIPTFLVMTAGSTLFVNLTPLNVTITFTIAFKKFNDGVTVTNSPTYVDFPLKRDIRIPVHDLTSWLTLLIALRSCSNFRQYTSVMGLMAP